MPSSAMQPIKIIAEAGTNHNGDLGTALELVEAAKKAGADCVKFQIIYPEHLYVGKIMIDGEMRDNPVIDERRKFMLEDQDYHVLAKRCRDIGIAFSASVFDRLGVDLLVQLGVPFIKIASVDLNNLALLRYAGATGLKIILSTGFSTFDEINRSVDEIEKAGCQDLVIMHCVSVYPSSLRMSNLQFLDQLETAFPYPLGFSDHSPTSMASAIACAKGVTWFEKHITLSKKQEGFDHRYALEPDEFAQYVQDLSDTREACALHEEKLTKEELEVSLRARRSLYAGRDMQAGEVLAAPDVLIVRPSGYFAASDIDVVIGRRLSRDIKQYENLKPNHLSEEK